MLIRTTSVRRRAGLPAPCLISIFGLSLLCGGELHAESSPQSADPWAQFGPVEIDAAETSDSPWPAVFEDAAATQISEYGCRTETRLPRAEPITQIGFSAYETQAPRQGDGDEVLRLAARLMAQHDRPLYVVGTSFSPDEKTHRLLGLAISRARSVAQRLAVHGVDPARLVCVPMAGAEPPAADWDKAVLIFAAGASAVAR